MTNALSCDRCGRSPVSEAEWLYCAECWAALRPLRHDFSPISGHCYACGEPATSAGPTCEATTAEPENRP